MFSKIKTISESDQKDVAIPIIRLLYIVVHVLFFIFIFLCVNATQPRVTRRPSVSYSYLFGTTISLSHSTTFLSSIYLQNIAEIERERAIKSQKSSHGDVCVSEFYFPTTPITFHQGHVSCELNIIGLYWVLGSKRKALELLQILECKFSPIFNKN